MSLRQDILQLAPWSLEVEVADGITTAVAKEASGAIAQEWAVPIPFSNPREGFLKTLHTIYPAGLQQRSFLDCGCNCGAFCFWAKEAGSGRTLGIDREARWIRQAEFIQSHRQLPLIEFLQLDIADLARRLLPRFDIVLMRGLVHCLADPLRGLQTAADLAREVLIVNTPVSDYREEEPGDGAFYLSRATRPTPLEAAQPYSWLPSGPRLLMHWLEAQSFAEVKLHFHTRAAPQAEAPNDPFATQGRVEIVASRIPGLTARLRTVVKSAS